MTYEHIQVDQSSEIAWLQMDRPAQHNAMNLEMADELYQALTDLSSETAIRCLVLTGVGETFNTGGDLQEFRGNGRDSEHVSALADTLHNSIETLRNAPFPVITGVNGVAAGAGVGLALHGDIVLACRSARFDLAYPRIGLSVDGGLSFLLPRLVGLRRAQALLLRDTRIGAAEAASIGLVTEVVPDDEFSATLSTEAEQLASGPTLAYSHIRGLLYRSYESGLREQMDAEAKSVTALSQTDDFARGASAFDTDQPPEFTGE